MLRQHLQEGTLTFPPSCEVPPFLGRPRLSIEHPQDDFCLQMRVGIKTLQKCGSENFRRFSVPKMSWNLAWNVGEIFRATFSRVWVCDGKFHQNFTSKTVWKTENFTQISLCWGAASKWERGRGDFRAKPEITDWRSPIPFWRVPLSILEAEIVLGVLCRQGGNPQKGSTVTLGFREATI